MFSIFQAITYILRRLCPDDKVRGPSGISHYNSDWFRLFLILLSRYQFFRPLHVYWDIGPDDKGKKPPSGISHSNSDWFRMCLILLSHVINFSGHYMCIETSVPRRRGQKARLAEAIITRTGSACFSFYYHMLSIFQATTCVLRHLCPDYEVRKPVWHQQL